MQISKHFKLSEEFTKSQVATRKGIKNMPGSGDIKNLENVAYEILEPVRAKFEKPVMINSGYRCLELNRKIGSSDSSQHTKGMAVDFEIIGTPNIQVAYWVKNNCDFDQLILEFYKPDEDNAGWIHASYCDGNNRKQVLTFDGKSYTDGLPDMEWKDGKVKDMIWFSLAKMAMKTGAEVYKNKQESKQLQSLAERNYSERMAKGEVDFKVKTLDAQSGSIKDEIVLFIVILPILVISYSVFSGSPDAKEKLDLFFQYFNNLPDWYVWLTVGIFGSIYGLKPGLDMFKKK